MKCRKVPKSCGMPSRRHIVRAQHVIFMAEPGMWMVAQSGTTNPATPSLTLFFNVRAKVTGMVAADDEVPRAVRYAGTIVASRRSGLRLDTMPATIYE